MKTIDLQKDSAQPYDACPFCLTKLTETTVEVESKLKVAAPEPILPKEKPTQKKEESAACHYHMGYLSEREEKGQIPDECICCKDILECMLKKMRQ